MFARRKRGFTLIELLIVVIVLGVLAAAALPRYQSFVMEARSRNCMTNLRNIEQAVGVWETRNFPLPSSVDYPLIHMYFRIHDGSVGSGTGMTTGATTFQAYAGPVATQVVAIVQEEKAFICPEVINRYVDLAGARAAAGSASAAALLGYSFTYRWATGTVPAGTVVFPANCVYSIAETCAPGQKRNATCNAFGLPNASSVTTIANFPGNTSNPVYMRGKGPDLTADFLHYGKK